MVNHGILCDILAALCRNFEQGFSGLRPKEQGAQMRIIITRHVLAGALQFGRALAVVPGPALAALVRVEAVRRPCGVLRRFR
eukprot:COSAG01_NODE_4506_length_4966_cov_76.601561_3_plen_82_part_00